MSRSRFTILLATALLIGAVVLLSRGFKKPDVRNPAPGEPPKTVSVSPRGSHAAGSPEGPAVRDSRPTPAATRDQISGWIADDSLSTEEAATKLWGVFADRRQTTAVRQEAMAHALNLTTDKRLVADFIPLYAQADLWNGELGEAALDELYNRGKGAKLAAGAALLPHAGGEFREHLRDLLRFELDEPEADDAKLIQAAQNKLSGKAAPETE
ncbi:hypothetical protein [Luteolibacter sp. LG18]|uniref:hypothetical protein n=1 Tax=Luteolibacter sp. LG18 TaxID=2819286 RepID=UPI002B2D2B4D|nr:hypothetical protein llg_23830 [Luteolibacter sp. LG18]